MEYRIRKSMEMLDSQLAITEVALNCGFSGASYYAETFRRIAGIRRESTGEDVGT